MGYAKAFMFFIFSYLERKAGESHIFFAHLLNTFPPDWPIMPQVT